MKRPFLILALATLLGATPAFAASTINQLPPIPFPLSDPGNPATAVENLWISSGTGASADFRITPTQLGYVFQGSTAPSSPTPFQYWWDTTANPRVLKVWTGSTWAVIGTLDTAAGQWTPVAAPTARLTPAYFGCAPAATDNTACLTSMLASGKPVFFDAMYKAVGPITVAGCPDADGGGSTTTGILFSGTAGGVAITCNSVAQIPYSGTPNRVTLTHFGLFTTVAGGGKAMDINFTNAGNGGEQSEMS
jgi:hypothetical protein